MLPSRDTSQLQGQIQTQNERVENDNPSKWHPEKSGNKRQRWTLHNDKGDHTLRSNSYQYLCSQSGSIKIYKATTNRIQGRN